MKLNHECVRDLLLYIEENSSYNERLHLNTITIKDYSTENIIYTADKLIEAGYLDCVRSLLMNSRMPDIKVKSITYDGHKFLDNIRDEGVWENTKSILSKFSSTSLGIISNISGQVISSIISKQLGLN